MKLLPTELSILKLGKGRTGVHPGQGLSGLHATHFLDTSSSRLPLELQQTFPTAFYALPSSYFVGVPAERNLHPVVDCHICREVRYSHLSSFVETKRVPVFLRQFSCAKPEIVGQRP
jgi:hypothetical protein